MKQKKRNQIALALTACLLILIAGVVSFTYLVTWLLRQDTFSTLEEVTQQSLVLVRQQTEKDMDTLTAMAAAVAALGGPESPEAKAYINNSQWRKEGVRLTVSDAGGQSYSNDGHTGNVGSEDIFRRAMAGEQVLSNALPSVLSPTKEPVIVLITPILQQGAAVGTLAAAFDVSLYETLAQVSLYGGTGVSHIIIPGSLPEESAERLRQDPQLAPIREDMAAGAGGQLLYQPDRGNASYLSYAPLGINDWYLVDELDAQVVENRKAVLRGLALGISLLVAALFAGVIALVLARESRRRKAMEQAAYHDRLTGLPNWQLLQSRYAALEPKAGWLFLLFRIPDFTRLSTMFGYQTGARLLKDIAAVLSRAVAPAETAARATEDHFCLLLNERGDRAAAQLRINEIFAALRELSLTDGAIVYDYHCSILGGAKFVEPEDELLALNRQVEAVLDAEARNAGVLWDWFDHVAGEQVALRDALMPEILRALKDEEFIPYFQPEYNVHTREVVGAEVLARWRHPQRGILMPGLFVPMLEAAGCVLELDLIMLEQACRYIQRWLSRGLLPVRLSVNISALNIHRKDFQERVLSIVRRYETPTNLLSLELTESVMFDNSQRVLELLHQFREEGFLLAMDDFGSDYSSLNMLREVPVDVIKLDRSLVRETEAHGQRGRVILSHVVDMARALGGQLIAEGVETKEQEDMVRDAGCSLIQGFYFSRPLSGEEFEKLLFQEDA